LARAAVLDDLHTQPTQFVPLAFNGNGHLALMIGTTAAFTAAFTAKIKLIRLDLARQRLTIGDDGAGP